MTDIDCSVHLKIDGFLRPLLTKFTISQDCKLIFPRMSNYSTVKTVANHEKLLSFSESAPSY